MYRSSAYMLVGYGSFMLYFSPMIPFGSGFEKVAIRSVRVLIFVPYYGCITLNCMQETVVRAFVRCGVVVAKADRGRDETELFPLAIGSARD